MDLNFLARFYYGFWSAKVGGVTKKLDGGGSGGGGGWWVVERVREIEIRERSEKYFYIILMCSMVK